MTGALAAPFGTLIELGGAVGGQLFDTGVMGLHASVNLIESVLGTIEQRPLNQAELEYLTPIFGDSIDFQAVTIQSGGIRDSISGLRAHVIGNDIFLPEEFFEADGVTLTEEGLDELGHEMAHVWQFQNGGPEYIHEAVSTQVNLGSAGIGSGEGYDWLTFANEGVRFNDMNPESQAELASFIGQSIVESTGEVDEAVLEAVIARELGLTSYDLPPETFAIVQEAHDILRAGG